MTAATSELRHRAESPYDVSVESARLFGINSDSMVTVERYNPNAAARDLETSTNILQTYGAVLLDTREISLADGERLADAVEQTIAEFVPSMQEHWNNEEVIRRKDYDDAYNDTSRHMRTVDYENIKLHFDCVMRLQEKLLPVIQVLTEDPEAAISVDLDEATVGNMQGFDRNADPSDFREHGAHTDRVDATAVVCIDNVGPNGELVVINGFTAACKRLGLDPHRNFNANLERIVNEIPEAITLRIHPVTRGAVLVLKSAADVHYIVPKTLQNVLDGEEAGHQPIPLSADGTEILGRAIINMAFETAACRELDKFAHYLEDRYQIHPQAKGNANEFFRALDEALATEIDSLGAEAAKYGNAFWEAVRSAIVTRFSAKKLYNKEITPGTANGLAPQVGSAAVADTTELPS